MVDQFIDISHNTENKGCTIDLLCYLVLLWVEPLAV